MYKPWILKGQGRNMIVAAQLKVATVFLGQITFFSFWKMIVAIAHLHRHRSKFAVAQERAVVFGTNYLPRDLSHKFTGGATASSCCLIQPYQQIQNTFT